MSQHAPIPTYTVVYSSPEHTQTTRVPFPTDELAIEHGRQRLQNGPASIRGATVAIGRGSDSPGVEVLGFWEFVDGKAVWTPKP